MGRFINADALVTTGQGIIGNNMFAYCNNNPVNTSDPNGKDPITIAAVGGAIAGGVVSLALYLHSAGDNASWSEALIFTTLGALGGAFGGAAGMATGSAQITYIACASVFAGISAELSGGSFVVGSIIGGLGAFAGTFLDISMFSGFDLGAASYVASTGVGFVTEMVSQSANELIPTKNSKSSAIGTPENSSGALKPSSSGLRNLAYVSIY